MLVLKFRTDLTCNLVTEYDSISKAALALGIAKSTIARRIKLNTEKPYPPPSPLREGEGRPPIRLPPPLREGEGRPPYKNKYVFKALPCE